MSQREALGVMAIVLVPGLVAVAIGGLLWGKWGALAGMCLAFAYIIGLVIAGGRREAS